MRNSTSIAIHTGTCWLNFLRKLALLNPSCKKCAGSINSNSICNAKKNFLSANGIYLFFAVIF
jgi:hypothetical protein